MSEDAELVKQADALRREILAVTDAKLPVADEVSAAVTRLAELVELAKRAPGHWLTINPTFSVMTFNDSMLANMALIAPEPTKALVIEQAKAQARLWTGQRMTAAERTKTLARLQGQLDALEAKAELARREAEADNDNLVLPRPTPWNPGIWLRTASDLRRIAEGKAA